MTVDHERPSGFPPIRRLGPADLKRCVALSVDRGWSPERAKWSLLLAASEVFGVDAPDGRGLAGAVVLTRWGPDFASVGMMLVAARYGRRGLGGALMEHLLAAAGENAVVTLFATDMGRPLYEKLGFAPVRRNVSFLGRPRPRPPKAVHGIRAAGRGDLPAILAVDRAAFGADRAAILGRLPGFADRIAVIENGHGIVGYAAAWRNHVTSTVIGPLVAPDAEAATCAHRRAGRPRQDTSPPRPGPGPPRTARLGARLRPGAGRAYRGHGPWRPQAARHPRAPLHPDLRSPRLTHG